MVGRDRMPAGRLSIRCTLRFKAATVPGAGSGRNLRRHLPYAAGRSGPPAGRLACKKNIIRENYYGSHGFKERYRVH